MKKSEGGVIVNISSILGLQPFPGCPIYSGSKHFVIGFSRSFGDKFHYEKYGVRVLTLCPGVTDTTVISEAHNRQLEPDISKLCGDELAALPPQTVDNVAEGMLHIIREAENGTVWVSEGGEPVYRVQIPDRLTLKV